MKIFILIIVLALSTHLAVDRVNYLSNKIDDLENQLYSITDYTSKEYDNLVNEIDVLLKERENLYKTFYSMEER